MFNSGYEMRSVTVTPLHNISSIFSNIFTFRLDKIGFSDEQCFLLIIKTLLLDILEMHVYILN